VKLPACKAGLQNNIFIYHQGYKIMKTINHFINMLKQSPDRNDVFNPWWEQDHENEEIAYGPQIRKKHLFQYLKERLPHVKYILVAEAIGYQGGHFSGIPMTSERILLGEHRMKGILPEHVFRGITPQRTSRYDLKMDGFSEPTATIVWDQLVQSGMSPYEFILWNAFPWHPFNPGRGKLSNRTPGKDEFKYGIHILRLLIDMCSAGNIIALGSKAAEQLSSMGIDALKVRHPARGGAQEFRKQFSEYIQVQPR
jgi:hypothetical protein